MKLDGSRVLVLGMGVTGKSANEVLRRAGAVTVTVDRMEPADHRDLDQLSLDGFDWAVASPGWPPADPQLKAVEDAGVEVVSEVELAWRLREERTPWVVVTGTNGKTTTVQMVGAMARAAGLEYAVVGNVGEPITGHAHRTLDLLVVEISSFQLHYTHSLEPLAAVCLNIDDDHLNWHGGAQGYRSDKAKVYRGVREACLYPADSPEIEQMVRVAEVQDGCRAVGLTLGIPGLSQLGVVDGTLLDRAFHGERERKAVEIATVEDLRHLVAGDVPPYLLLDALAAAGLARARGIEPEHIRDGLRSFRLDAHRTEHVASIDGVAYVDDSKATNAHAAKAAFGAIPQGTAVWIVGGLAKGADLAPLVDEVSRCLRAAVVIGVDQQALIDALGRHAPGIPVSVIPPGDTVMERAVEAARGFACPGDTVLLSPACASMDQFRDYAHRGDEFAAVVRTLHD